MLGTFADLINRPRHARFGVGEIFDLAAYYAGPTVCNRPGADIGDNFVYR
jgi:hypothetical protein